LLGSIAAKTMMILQMLLASMNDINEPPCLYDTQI